MRGPFGPDSQFHDSNSTGETMSSNRSMTFIHFYSIIATMFVLMLGTLAYMSDKDRAEREEKLLSAVNSEKAATTALRNALDDIESLKRAMGYGHEEVGQLDDANSNTTLGNLELDFKQLNVSLPDRSVASALASLNVQRQNLKQERDNLQEKIKELQKQILALEDIWSAKLAVQSKARENSETELAKLIKNKEEIVGEKDNIIADYSRQIREAQLQIASYDEQIKTLEKESADRQRLMAATVTRLRNKLNKIEGDNPKPDAKVIRVNSAYDTAWIDVGLRDKLRKGITFSVYGKNQSANGKPKARLIVTDVSGDKMAECRVTESKLTEPITSGDWVSSAIWDAGQVHQVAIAGPVDIDSDGTDDFPALSRWLTNSGVQVAAYIDQNGDAQGQPIDADIRFLVTTKLPDLTAAKTESQRLLAQRTLASFTTMRRAADLYGVQIITLKDFLDKVGYKPMARLK